MTGRDEPFEPAPPSAAADPDRVWADDAMSRALFEQSPLSTVIYDAEGRLLAVNGAFRALWGVGIESAPPDYSVLTDPELERQGALPAVRRAFAGQAVTLPPVHYDICRVATTGQGRTVWTQGHLFPVRGGDGRVTHVVLTHVDLTPVMEAEEALRASEERFRGAQEASPAGFGILAPVRGDDGRITDFEWVYANPAAGRFQGIPAEALAGHRLLERNPGALASGLFAAFVETSETGAPFEREVRYRHEWFDTWFRITAVRLRNGLALTFADVSDRYRAEERGRGLLALATGLTEAATPEEVADVIFREGLRALHADGGSLGLVRELDGEDALVEMVRTQGYGAEAEARYHHFPVTPGRPLSDAIMAAAPVLLGSAAEWEARYPGQFAANIEPLGYEAYAALPVTSGGAVLAGLSFSFRGARAFDEQTRTFLDTIGHLCAQALERARAFDAERRARQRTETVLGAVRDGFAAFDRDFRYTYVNEHAAEILGVPAARLLGRRLWEVFPDLQGSPFAGVLRECMDERRVVTRENWSPVLRRWLAVRCYPADDGIVLFFQDVTERRRGEDAAAFLAEATRVLSSSLDYETTLRALAAAAVPRLADWCAIHMLADPTSAEWPPRVDRLAVVHKDPERLRWAEEFERRRPTDWDQPGGLAKVLREGVSEFYPRIPEAMVTAAARSGEDLALLREIRLNAAIIVPLVARGRTLGALTLIMAESARVYDEADLRLAEDLAQRAAVAVDNARLYRDAERARHEAEAANRAKSDFLATMSHELRTPLNAIGGYTQLLEMELRGPLTPQQRGDLERIRRSQEHLLGLINAVLSFARVEAGHVVYEPADVDLGALLAGAAELVEAQARARGLSLEVQHDGPPLHAWADAEKVRQVVLNLLSNALKFTPAGGTVALSCTRAEGGCVAVRVRDTGVGIAADQLEQVFDPFVQVGRSLSSPVEGTGLGLAISRDLARGMGGDLAAESTPGAGSVFTLLLPAAAPNPAE